MATQGKAFKLWYQKNRKKLALRRRKRYHSDPKYRRAAIERSAEYKRRRRETLRGDRRPIGEVAQALGVTTATLRRWEAAGYFPKSGSWSKHRRFTDAQVKLLGTLSKRVQALGWKLRDQAVREKFLTTFVANLTAKWDAEAA